MIEAIKLIKEQEKEQEIDEKESLELFNLLIQQDIECLNRTR